MVHLVLIEYKNEAEVERCVSLIRETTGDLVSTLSIVRNSEKNENIHRIWNRELKVSKAEFFSIMNPDTTPVGDWLHQMVELLHNQPQVACVGPSTDHCYNEQANRHPEVVKFARGSWVPQVLCPGFSTVFRSRPLKALGGWREDFTFYGGDLDLVYRLQLAGWMTAWLVSAFVWHVWGGAAKKLGDARYREIRRLGDEELGRAINGYTQLPGLWVHVGGGKVERRRLDGAEEEALQVQGQDDAS